jgi:hypothetical protein
LTQCIQGRRPKVFNSGVVKAAAAEILAALDDSNSDRLNIGSLTILSGGAGTDGIVDLITEKNAKISSSLIIEVKLSKKSQVLIEYTSKRKRKGNNSDKLLTILFLHSQRV